MSQYFKQFGGKITKALESQYETSKQWKGGSFKNLEHTTLGGSLLDFPRIIYKQLSNRDVRVPEQPLPIVSFNKDEFLKPSDTAKFIWYGHSVVLMRVVDKTILIDPMLGPNTTPIAPLTTKRFSEDTLDIIDDFPQIDLILLTHDHYDHLDLASIEKLKHKTKSYYVALGVKRHLEAWGIQSESITEFDWWQSQSFGNLEITFTPTRHFSGRGLNDRAKTLWGGWAIKSHNENIWFSGDGGYGKHFKEVGEKLGPFNIAFMECGQYNEDWKLIHLFPEEAVQAAIDAKVTLAMPVHWAAFALSYQHTWQEPAEDFVKYVKEKQMDYVLPKIGELFNSSSNLKELWWQQFK
ncbi:MAG: MBL fold metallo-hydrolase [Bacteroidota bacterium]